MTTDDPAPSPASDHHPNPSTALARTLVDELARGGIAHAVVAPGSRNTALAVALVEHPGIRVHVHPDERSAAFVAIGIARASGRPAVVVTTSGSATANLYPAVVEADSGDVPLLLVTADRPAELRHTGANQTTVQPGMFGATVRWAVEIPAPSVVAAEPAFWRATVCRAVDEADGTVGPPGPVHLDVAFREPTVPVADDGRTLAAPYPHATDGRADGARWTTSRRIEPDHAGRGGGAALLATALDAARRPLVVAGGGAGVGARHLAEALGCPLIAEPHSEATGGTHEVAHADLVLGSAAVRQRLRPDLVVQVGRPGLSRALERWLGPEIPQVLIDRHGRRHDPARGVSHLIVGEPDLVLADVGDVAIHGSEDGWWECWQTAVAAVRAALDVGVGTELSEPATARTVTSCVPDGGTLVVASSRPIRDVNAYAAVPRDIRVVANRGASGIDGLVSTALGAALVGGGPTVALLGDLSLLHDSNGFLLAADALIDLVVVVVDNDGGGLFHLLPQARHLDAEVFERVIATPHGRDLGDLARLHRLAYAPVSTTDELRSAIADGVSVGGLHLVHVRTERHATQSLDTRLRAAATAAVEDALDC